MLYSLAIFSSLYYDEKIIQDGRPFLSRGKLIERYLHESNGAPPESKIYINLHSEHILYNNITLSSRRLDMLDDCVHASGFG